jgi:hypothetical protein
MTLDLQVLKQVVGDEYGKLPHPEVPALTNAEFPVYERVAKMMNHPNDPTPKNVEDAYNQLQAVGLSPHQWEHAWTIAQPVSQSLLDRDPTLQELLRHADAHPGDIHNYYSESPSPSHPEIKAGEMKRYQHIAAEAAGRHLERKPLLHEIAHFASMQAHVDYVDLHYDRIRQAREDQSNG